jgi:hypothetical protein
MKITVTILTVLLVGLASATAQFLPATANKWFPLQEGNEWVLRGTNDMTHVITCDEANGLVRAVTGLFREEVLLRLLSPNSPNLLGKYAEASRWSPAFRFGRPDERPWIFDLSQAGCDRFLAKWTQSGLTIETPAGTFSHARRLELTLLPSPQVRCRAPLFTDLWFAPMIGPVAARTSAGEVLLLASAQIGGRTVPPQPGQGMVAVLTSDRDLYFSLPATNYCPPCVTNALPCLLPCVEFAERPAVARFEFRVTNQTGSSQTFQFPSRQQFDIELIDRNGRVVRAWSDGQMFTQAVTEFTLLDGESKSFPASLPLTGRDGGLLVGDFHARAFLTNLTGPSDVEAVKPIHVRLAVPMPVPLEPELYPFPVDF